MNTWSWKKCFLVGLRLALLTAIIAGVCLYNWSWFTMSIPMQFTLLSVKLPLWSAVPLIATAVAILPVLYGRINHKVFRYSVLLIVGAALTLGLLAGCLYALGWPLAYLFACFLIGHQYFGFFGGLLALAVVLSFGGIIVGLLYAIICKSFGWVVIHLKHFGLYLIGYEMK